MAVYGRLDVFWPDGKIESFVLAEDNVTVGRSTGSTFALETDTLSRYHFNITRDAGGVYLTDLESVNGTFVDGSRIRPQERILLSGGEELQAGFLRFVYHDSSDIDTTTQTASLSDVTQRVEGALFDFRLELQPPPIAIAPGSYTTAELIIYNTASTAQTFTVEAGGLPEGWLRVNRPILEVAADDHATVVVNIKPIRRSESAPGVYTAVVAVRRQDKPEIGLEVPFQTVILPYSGLGMALGAKRLGVRDTLQVFLHNQGSAPLGLILSGASPQNSVQVILQPAQISLAPGQRLQLRGEVRPLERRLFGRIKEHAFEVVARSQDNAHYTLAVSGQLIQKPPLPGWAALAMGLGGVIAALLVLMGLLGLLTQRPALSIAYFNVQNPAAQIPQTEPLLLSWQVRNADQVTIYANEQVIASYDRATGTLTDAPYDVTLSIALPPGEVLLRLVAANAQKTVDAQQTITLYAPVMATSFTLLPQPIVRHVVQTLTVTYAVENATNISFDGINAIAQTAPAIPPGSSGTFSFTALPEFDFSLTLNASGEFNATAQQTITVVLVDPMCAPIGTSAALFGAPDPTAPIVSTVTGGVNIVVDARDADGEWLRAVAPNGSGLAWGKRADFTCAPNFNVDDLRLVVVDAAPANPTNSLPLPPLTVVATIPATPTVVATLPPLPLASPTPTATRSS
ncbi:MAG: FHA domain-containing protein [Armatimonadetes bacterium]|nr:FHA domain-containing protein [Anaerolineae bacterium]